ncbi:MAG TPA: phosphate-starvation-inducible PsiE family protein [Geobacteraceae bacterium]|nr:phosphate-starvation-inducible PsiE family protein [Geobacteraceae bacterium]
MWKEDVIDLKLTRFFEISARALLSLLIVAILLAIMAGVIYTFYDLRLIFRMDFLGAFKSILVDMLTVLALVEVLRTALAYFSEGRVKVTYIIDTVIVTVLTEVMAFWYKDMEWEKLAMVIALVLSLAFVRIIAVRFSPRKLREEL